jgi:hypothetical protein
MSRGETLVGDLLDSLENPRGQPAERRRLHAAAHDEIVRSIDSADEAAADLAARVHFLLDTFGLYGPDGCFTFPDGETWTRPQPPPARTLNRSLP